MKRDVIYLIVKLHPQEREALRNLIEQLKRLARRSSWVERIQKPHWN